MLYQYICTKLSASQIGFVLKTPINSFFIISNFGPYQKFGISENESIFFRLVCSCFSRQEQKIYLSNFIFCIFLYFSHIVIKVKLGTKYKKIQFQNRCLYLQLLNSIERCYFFYTFFVHVRDKKLRVLKKIMW